MSELKCKTVKWKSSKQKKTDVSKFCNGWIGLAANLFYNKTVLVKEQEMFRQSSIWFLIFIVIDGAKVYSTPAEERFPEHQSTTSHNLFKHHLQQMVHFCNETCWRTSQSSHTISADIKLQPGSIRENVVLTLCSKNCTVTNILPFVGIFIMRRFLHTVTYVNMVHSTDELWPFLYHVYVQKTLVVSQTLVFTLESWPS